MFSLLCRHAARRAFAAAAILLAAAPPASPWGLRGHTLVNLAAVEGIPADGPVFLRPLKGYVGHLGIVPDTWRSHAEPYLRISEDPNHGWYLGAFDFLKEIPRSRTEHTLRVYDEYQRTRARNPERAKELNIRYTGTTAYSAMEGYERVKAGMRLYRNATAQASGMFTSMASRYASVSPAFNDPEAVRDMLARDIAFYLGWLGHYIADAAQPLHNTIHHDGWVGPNPANYTRDPNIHGLFETEFVDLMLADEAGVNAAMRAPRHLDDPWAAIHAHMAEAAKYVEEVYRLEQQGAYKDKDNAAARALVNQRLAAGASFLRDLAYTAWIESARPVPPAPYPPNSPKHPRYNPETGSAPAPEKPVR